MCALGRRRLQSCVEAGSRNDVGARSWAMKENNMEGRETKSSQTTGRNPRALLAVSTPPSAIGQKARRNTDEDAACRPTERAVHRQPPGNAERRRPLATASTGADNAVSDSRMQGAQVQVASRRHRSSGKPLSTFELTSSHVCVNRAQMTWARVEAQVRAHSG